MRYKPGDLVLCREALYMFEGEPAHLGEVRAAFHLTEDTASPVLYVVLHWTDAGPAAVLHPEGDVVAAVKSEAL
jgi:hypothetical protein